MPLPIIKSTISTSSCLSSGARTVFSCCLSSSNFSDQIPRSYKNDGVDSISMDMKDKKLTVVGDIDAADIVAKLRKLCHADIISVGPAKEPEKYKEEPKKPEGDKKDKDPVAEWVKAYQTYNPYLTTHYHVRSIEEDPNACVIS